MTDIIFICPNCQELIHHFVAADIGPYKVRASAVPVTLAYAVDKDTVTCDRCYETFTAEMLPTPETTTVKLT